MIKPDELFNETQRAREVIQNRKDASYPITHKAELPKEITY